MDADRDGAPVETDGAGAGPVETEGAAPVHAGRGTDTSIDPGTTGETAATGDVPDARTRRIAAGAALLVALVALAARYVALLDVSLAYDEATYVEIAAHPWRSSYYPDTVFLRHPPLAFLLMGAWSVLTGGSEAAMRLLSVLCAGAGTVLLWDAMRRRGGLVAAALAGVLLAGAFTVLAYAVQATLYPVAFLAVAVALHGRARTSRWQERAGLAAFALAHLFGFVFLGLHLLRERRHWRREWGWAAAPAVWLVAASGLALAANPDGDVMRLGPSGQFLRGLVILDDALRDWRLHLATGLLGLLLLNPVLLRSAWEDRWSWGPWIFGTALLAGYLFVAPMYVRYGLLLLPIVLVAGLPRLLRPEGRPRRVAAVLAVAAFALPSGVAYVTEGPDPNAAVDLPGGPDWRQGAAEVASGGVVATPVPTSLAYYLERDHGYAVVDSSGGPYLLRLEHGDGRTMEILGMPPGTSLPDAPRVLYPARWQEQTLGLEARGWTRCGGSPDPVLLCAPDHLE